VIRFPRIFSVDRRIAEAVWAADPRSVHATPEPAVEIMQKSAALRSMAPSMHPVGLIGRITAVFCCSAPQEFSSCASGVARESTDFGDTNSARLLHRAH